MVLAVSSMYNGTVSAVYTYNLVIEKETAPLSFNNTSSQKNNTVYDILVQTDGFADISDIEWVIKAINSLAEKNIISGRNSTTFAPNDNITRS